MRPSFERGPVRVYSGEKNGKYPDGNQVIVQGTDRRAAFDSPLVANRIGADYDAADLVIQGSDRGIKKLDERGSSFTEVGYRGVSDERIIRAVDPSDRISVRVD